MNVQIVLMLPTKYFRRFRLQQKCNRSTDMNRSEAATVVFGYQSSIESRKPLSTYSVIDAGRIVWTAESMERSGVRPSVRLSVLSIDSSNGGRRVCYWAPCGQETSIAAGALRVPLPSHRPSIPALQEAKLRQLNWRTGNEGERRGGEEGMDGRAFQFRQKKFRFDSIRPSDKFAACTLIFK